jgi:hypothetical protein
METERDLPGGEVQDMKVIREAWLVLERFGKAKDTFEEGTSQS